MSRLILFTVLAVTALSSCSVYRYGDKTNTPDDVYYSPTRPGAAAAYVETDRQNGNGYYNTGDSYSYDDRWLRMRVRDRYRWNAFDDYDWNYGGMMYNPYYASSYNPYYFNSYWNSYYAWNYNYNPYIGKVILVNPSINAPVFSKVRNVTPSLYNNRGYNNANRPIGAKYYPSNYNNSNTRSSSLGSSLKKVFSNGNSNNGSYYTPSSSGDRPTRTYTPPANTSSSSSSSRGSSSGPSSSGSSGSSGGGGGGGAGSRPGRGN